MKTLRSGGAAGMGVGLSLIGHLTDHPDRLTRVDVRDWLARAAVWFEALGDAVLDTRLLRDAEERPVLLAAFHPAVEPVEMRIGASGKLKLNASTSPAGPGYHAYLCKVLLAFAADFEVRWDMPAPDHDPGRCFASQGEDLSRLETHFLRWLSTTCTRILPTLEPNGKTYPVGMPRHPRFLHPGPVQTPGGPRPVEWLKAVAADSKCGKDFFPWWAPELDAAFYRGRALTELWLEFRWRPPITEAEGEQVDQVAADLANAFDLDPTIDLPWAAWYEVISAITRDQQNLTVEPIVPGLTEEVARRALAVPSSEIIGYRRYPIRANLHAGWHLDVPGSLASLWEDHRTWTAWDTGRSIWFRGSSLDAETSPDVALAAARRSLPPGEPVPGPIGGDLVGEAVFGPHQEEDGKSLWRLSGIAAGPGRLAACNIYVSDERDHDWAIHIWHSLRHEERPGTP